MKILMLAILLTASETALLSQTPTYPNYRNSPPNNPVTYYPTYSTTLPTPQTKRPTVAMAIVWRGSLVNELTINAAPGERYGLESSTDLRSWTEIEKVFIGVSGQRIVRIPFDPSAPQKFFRLTK